jgi:PAS domain-containing protein
MHPAMTGDGWAALFANAFSQSRNPMLLVDGDRCVVDANGAFVRLLSAPRHTLVGCRLPSLVAGGPLATAKEWRNALAQGRFNGEADLLRADGTAVAVQWAACAEVATGRRLVLFVALTSSRWGGRLPPSGTCGLACPCAGVRAPRQRAGEPPRRFAADARR